MSIYVDDRFRRAIGLHLARNLLSTAAPVPLVLGIAGPSGEGKTFQTARVLEEAEFVVHSIGGGELESDGAGVPAERIRQAYLVASRERRTNGVLSAIVINDFDTAVGDWGSAVQYTVNRQNVFAQLMDLCDNPELVQRVSCLRIPIIVTGNDFTRLYGPLVRAGRMKTFHWAPTVEQRIPIVERVLSWLTHEEVVDLVSGFPSQPVSFWAEVASQVHDDTVWSAIQSIGIAEATRRAAAGQTIAVGARPAGAAQVRELAASLSANGHHLDYLTAASPRLDRG